jgi:hypothetical protein
VPHLGHFDTILPAKCWCVIGQDEIAAGVSAS